MNQADKLSYNKWKSYLHGIRKQGEVNYLETEQEKQQRIKYLESEPLRWMRYHFPDVCRCEFADWHQQFVGHAVEYDECYITLKVCRDMAKSSVDAMLLVYLHIVKRVKVFGEFSKTYDQACELLRPVQRAFLRETIIRDYGNLVGAIWTDGYFETTLGGLFAAFGSGMPPRGMKSDESLRLEVASFDDFDDDEVCRNPERLENAWQYCLAQVYPAFHVSGIKRIFHLNNRIADDCIIQRAWNHAPSQKNFLRIQVNLTDNEGHSNWPEAYTDEQCKVMINLSGIYARAEYYNEPVKRGTTFKPEWIQYKKMPPLSQYKHVVAYLDGGFKKSKTADTKALVLIGMWQGEYHVRRAYVDNVSIETMISWHYDLFDWLKSKNAAAVWWMEEVFLLSLLHDHFDAAIKKYKFRIPMQGDKRKKPDKDLRIMNLAGYFERNNLFFDEAAREDRHMKRLIDQFLGFIPGSKGHEKDGPDATEGAIHMLQTMIGVGPDKIGIGRRLLNKHRA